MPEPGSLGRLLILAGAGIALVGVLMLLVQHVGLGRLPGDLVWRRGNFTLFVPLATSLILSLLLTVLLNLLFRRH